MKIHITKDGQTYGPYTLNEVNAALAGGELSPDDLAWHEGAPGWIMLGAVDGVVTPRSARSMPLPPPVRSVSVADELEDGQISSQAFGYAYSIIVAVGIIAEIVLEAATQGKTSIPWLVYAGAYGGIYVWEKKQLSDPSLMPSSWWLLFVPAYLYKRAKAFRQPMGSFLTFNAVLVLASFIAVAQDDTLTLGAPSSPSGNQGSLTTIRQMAEKGDAAAQLKLGVMYKNGEGVEVNYAEAAKWFRKATDQGNAEAQFNLGNMYKNGEGVEVNYAEAVKWYRNAADQEDASAQNNLGNMYDNGRGVPKDKVEAVKWYRKAADQGDDRAQNNLGIMYANGEGVPKDAAEAAKWYRKAADQGAAQAQNNLGNAYANGEGVVKNKAEAVKWYRKAADQGLAYAQVNLSLCYDRGEGVVKDDVESYKWDLIAGAKGNPDAKKNITIAERKLTPAQRAEGQRRANAWKPVK